MKKLPKFTIRSYKGNSIAKNRQFDKILRLSKYDSYDYYGLFYLYKQSTRKRLTNNYSFAIARVDGEPVGITAFIKKTNSFYVQSFVKPKFRRKGISTKLVLHLLNKYKKKPKQLGCFSESHMKKVLSKAVKSTKEKIQVKHAWM